MGNDARYDINLSNNVTYEMMRGRAHKMPYVTIKRKHLVAQNVRSFA